MAGASVALLAVSLAPGAAGQATGGAGQVAGQVGGPANGPSSAPGVAGSASAVVGGTLHGVVKSGSIPLPGVAVTATNTLTGKRVATTTDVTGAWSMTIGQNGRYVLRTEFAAFAGSTHEALLNANSHDAQVNFDLTLASRVAQQDAKEQQGQAGQIQQAMRQLGVNGAQSLSLMSSLASGTDAAEGGTTASGTVLPGAAASAASGTDSVAINGQSGTVSPLAGVDVDRIRDAIETARAQGGGDGGGFFGGAGFGGGGGGFGGAGGFGGGRGNFRGFRPDQPHGSVFWTGSNSALNALPFSLRGQAPDQPDYGSNRFGLTFIGEPYIPKLTKPSGKDTLFLTLSGSRTSTPFNQYAVVPTAAQRGSCVDAVVAAQSAACNLLSFFPLPNLAQANGSYNYYFASTGQSNATSAGIRYIRSIGSNAGLPTGGGRGGGGGGRRNQQTQGLRQSVNANFNYSDSASDNLNIFPELGGKTAGHNYSLQTGYSLGYHRWNNNLTGGWNRALTQTTNFFTNKTDIATELGIQGPDGGSLNTSPLNYGVPNVVLGGTQGLNEQQPSFALQQTITLSNTLSYGHGKHNYRFGGDLRRVHQDFLGSGNATGTFYFSETNSADPFSSLIAGTPQESTIQSANQKSYLRQNTWDLYAQDDFRAFANLTLNYGVRYEYFSPYAEKYDHLAEVGFNSQFTQTAEITPGCTGAFCSTVPRTLVYPFRPAFAPRVGIALRLPKSTVVRAGYAINYTNGQYSSFAKQLAYQPPFANVQINEASQVPITVADGFPTPESDQKPTFAVEPHYTLPYVQVWNMDVQKTMPLGIVLNVGYNGSKGTHLDVKSAPLPCQSLYPPTGCTQTYNGAAVSAVTPVLFGYEQSSAFSNFNAGTIRLRKRLQKGVSMGVNYTYSHSIDDAGAIGGTATVVAQNWRDLQAEESSSSIDQRHKLTGDYLFELPFGKDKQFLTTGGVASKILEGLSVSGTFTFASGTPLTPAFVASASELSSNTAGSQRPNLTGQPIGAGGGSLLHWFNTGAFDPTPPSPAAPYGGVGNSARNSITGPGTVSNTMSLSKTAQLGDTRSFEGRATANNVFNTVQYSGVDTNVQSLTFGQVTSTAGMRSFSFLARYRF